MSIKINKDKILKDFQADYASAKPSHDEWVEKKEKYLDETYGKPYGNETQHGSKIVSKDIKRQLEWLIPGITDPFLNSTDVIKCNPVTYEDVKAAKQNELILNTQFTRKFDRYNFITRAARVLATEGTCIIQTGWEYEDEKVIEKVKTITEDEYGDKFITVEEKEVLKTVTNKPTAKVCRGEDVYIDPTCMGDLDKAQFIIYRYETDLSTLRKDGRYKNLKQVARNLVSDDIDYRKEDTTEFEFKDTARKKIVVYEYWGNYDIDESGIAKPIVCTWTDSNVIIRLEDNPYPDKKPPFLVVPFTPIPFQVYGEALAENIGDRQKVKTAITRGLIENMAQSTNGQKGIRKGALDSLNKKRFLSGKNFEYNGTVNDFWQGNYNQIPSSAFNMLQLMDNDIESQTGVKSFGGGINGSAIGNTATSVRATMDATGMRKLNLVRNIADNLIKPLMRKWMAYNAEFLDEEEVVRITNDEFVPIKKDDLEGNIDIDIEISTVEDNSAKVQQLSFLMQTIGNSMGQELMQIILAEITALQKMPNLAHKIENYQPQQDPTEEQAKQLEMQKLALENERLKSEIQDYKMKAYENKFDGILKEAKARVENAKADKLISDRDLTDLKFLKENEGIDHQQKLEQELTKAEITKQLAILQAKLGGKKEQIGLYEG